MAISIAINDASWFGVLSSTIHLEWVYANRSLIGVASFEQGHRYNKTLCFDPFPFPDPTPEQRVSIADIGEELDDTRKGVLAKHSRLTMTGLYNLVEKLRAGATLTPAEEVDARDARARIVAKLHDDLDQAVADAYGWGEEWRQAPLPPAEIVARLVRLNAERAAEEKAGLVRWLRPDYQIPRFATAAEPAAG